MFSGGPSLAANDGITGIHLLWRGRAGGRRSSVYGTRPEGSLRRRSRRSRLSMRCWMARMRDEDAMQECSEGLRRNVLDKRKKTYSTQPRGAISRTCCRFGVTHLAAEQGHWIFSPPLIQAQTFSLIQRSMVLRSISVLEFILRFSSLRATFRSHQIQSRRLAASVILKTV